ncbi:hypothetical protein JCM8097_000658 [Rhodosporidiobolus ruineniae]
MLLFSLLLLAALALPTAHAEPPKDEPDYTPIWVPLAVRSPYLGAWLSMSRNQKNLAREDPHFWTTQPLGWKGLLRVDGETWNWMGDLTEWPACNNASLRTTAASSAFTFTNEPPTVSLTAEFLSPITPADLFRQSLPFSYLHLSVESLDGQPHAVEAYSEINGLWLADEEDEELLWDSLSGGEDKKGEDGWTGVKARLKDQRNFVETYKQDEFGTWMSTDRIMHGEIVYAAQASEAVETSFSAGHDAMATRREFAETGRLSGTSNSTSPRPIRTRSLSNSSEILDEPVLALSHSFGRVGPSTKASHRSALLAIGHVRDPLVQYMTPDPSGSSTGPDSKPRLAEKVIELRPLWRSTFPTLEKLLSFFLSDYDHAKQASEDFNTKLYADARAVDGEEYAHVVAISTRQIYQAMEAVWDESEEGKRAEEGLVAYSPVTGEPVPAMVFMKEISSNGNVQTVDVIAPFLPHLLYASPSLLPLLLEPIYRYMSSGLYVPTPPAHDIGDHYPNATGHNDFLYAGLPIEETGNMLLLAWAGMQVAEPATEGLDARVKVREWWDSTLASSSDPPRIGWEARVGKGRDHRREGARMAWAQARERYGLLKGWAKYLEEECLYPGDQRTTDDFFGSSPNQTSLVIKGILGMRAFSEIASSLGESSDADYYRGVSSKYRDIFLDLAVAKDGSHLMSTYNNQTLWITHYNLYFDLLLGLDVFPQSVYDMQTAFYPKQAGPYGPPLDSRFPNRAKTDWLAWASATCSPLLDPFSPSARADPCRRSFLDGLARYFREDVNAVFGDSINEEGWSVGFLVRPVAGGHYSLLGLQALRQARVRAMRRMKEREGRWWFELAVLVGVGLVGLVSWRAVRRWRNRRRGYVELGAPGGGRRRLSAAAGMGAVDGADERRGSEMSVWSAGGTPTVPFALGDEDDEEDAEEEVIPRRG